MEKMTMKQLTLDGNAYAWFERAQNDERFRKKIIRTWLRNFTHACPICGRKTRFAICTKCRKVICREKE